MRGCVAPSRVYFPPGAWTTLLAFLIERFRHVEPSILRARLERGEMVDESGMPQAPASSFLAGCALCYYPERPEVVVVPLSLPRLSPASVLGVVDKQVWRAVVRG